MKATTLEEVRRKFKRCINEYNDPYGIYEDDDQQGDMQGGDMGTIGGPEGEDPMAGAGGMGPDQGPTGPEQGPMDGGVPQDAGMHQGGGQPQGPEGFQPQGVDPNAGFEGMGGAEQANPDLGLDDQPADDEVIDVDDLTDAQEKTEEKVDDLSNKFGKVLSSLDDIIDRIDRVERRTADNLDSIKREIEMRNPTPIQKMSMRTAQSTPYQITPTDYMNNDAPANYSAEDDNNGVGDPQYTITNADIDNFTDYGSVSRQFDKGLSLKDILNF